MSRVAKYRRQVSEDPDIDNLLSTLSPEEMEQLEKELDAGDPDAGVSAGFNRSQTERASHQREAERERFAQNKAPVDHEKVQEKIKDKPKPEEKKTEQKTQDTHSSKGSEDVKDAKTRRSAFRRDNEKPKDTQVTKLAEKLGEDSNTKDKDKTERAQSRKPIEEKSIKQTGKDKENIKKAEEKEKTKETTDKKAEDKREKPPERTTINKTPATKEKAVSNKTAPEENALKEEGKKNLPKTVEPGSEIPENGTQNQTDSNKEDESSSIFNDLLEKVKNNDSEIIDLNLNNSDCITIETLMSFTEALEFNTMVKIFSLANTRADDHIALAISAMLKSNKTITSINLDSNQITGKGILAIFRALQHNTTLTELRFHNQRHICGGKTEMEIAKILKENTTLLKLGYHFELAGPRMTVTNLLSRNMDKQRQRRLAEQRMSQGTNNKKDCLEVPKVVPPQKASPKSSPLPSKKNAQKVTSKKGDVPTPPPPPPPLAPLAPPLINENIRNSLSPASQRRIVEKTGPSEKNSRDELLESIRSSNIKQLKKVEVPKWLK
ncbi:leiomodin-1 [Spea bombifrons]|uniref:leiomodin-1 n=1 Tax=Spea bombifrons TaxID=233779 RepID=UPI00234AB0CE|nr:leiomodin-1 [Spea bombifrons]